MLVTRSLVVAVLSGAFIASFGCSAGPEEVDEAAAGAVETGEETVPAPERYRAVVVPEGLTWEEARSRAEADGGHLVTITSADENAQVLALVAERAEIWANYDGAMIVDGEEAPLQVTIGPWIGLHQPSGSAEPDGGWVWVTGEALGYTNWSPVPNSDESEPNDNGGVEDYANLFGPGLDDRSGRWNDMPNDPEADFSAAGMEFTGEVPSPRGYVVEFEQE